jgi:hypothetical protein
MKFLDHEVKALHALVEAEIGRLCSVNTKELDLDPLLDHYRRSITIQHLKEKLTRSLERRNQIREPAAAGSDDRQPT